MEKMDMPDASLDARLSKLKIERRHKRPKRFRFRWSWLIALLVLAVLGYGAYMQATAPLAVRTVSVEREAVDPGRGPALLTATGYVVPRHKIEVSSKIIGRVVEVLVKRGDRVAAGDVLIRLEDADYQARVAQAKAQAATLEARLRELQTGSRAEEIAAARAAVLASEAELRNAQLEFARTEELTRGGVATKQDRDRARATLDVAEARLNADRNNARLVEVGPRQEVIDAAQAQLHQAEAELNLAQTELDYTVIRAPISGTVLEKLAELGELVTNSNFGGTRGAKTSLLSMADLTDLQVEVDVNQAELPKVQIGRPAEIRLDMNPDVAYQGRVDEISPQADRQKGTVQVKVAIVNPDDAIRTEVNARVTFLGAADPAQVTPEKPRLWVPRPAVVRTGAETRVFVIEVGRAAERPIRTGIEAEKGVEVLEGLTGDETVIVGPMDQVKPGVRVEAAQ